MEQICVLIAYWMAYLISRHCNSDLPSLTIQPLLMIHVLHLEKGVPVALGAVGEEEKWVGNEARVHLSDIAASQDWISGTHDSTSQIVSRSCVMIEISIRKL